MRHHAHADAGIGRDQHRQSSAPPLSSCRAGCGIEARSRRSARERRRSQQARACAATPLRHAEIDGHRGTASAPAGIRGDQHAGGRPLERPRPDPAARSRPTRGHRSECKARAPALAQRAHQRLPHAPRDAENCDGLHAASALVDRAGKELLDALEEGLLARLVAALLQRGLEFLQQLLLLGAQGSPASPPPPGRTDRRPRRRAPAARPSRARETPARIGSRSES